MPPYNTRTSKLLPDRLLIASSLLAALLADCRSAAVRIFVNALGSVIQMSYSVSSYNRKQKVSDSLGSLIEQSGAGLVILSNGFRRDDGHSR